MSKASSRSVISAFLMRSANLNKKSVCSLPMILLSQWRVICKRPSSAIAYDSPSIISLCDCSMLTMKNELRKRRVLSTRDNFGEHVSSRALTKLCAFFIRSSNSSAKCLTTYLKGASWPACGCISLTAGLVFAILGIRIVCRRISTRAKSFLIHSQFLKNISCAFAFNMSMRYCFTSSRLLVAKNAPFFDSASLCFLTL